MSASAGTAPPLGWFGIVRLGLVQSAIGAMVMLATSLLNRVMVVEYALPAALPAGLVAWHYAVQLTRPLWGHGSDRGRRRTPWIIGGMGVLALGVLAAVDLVPWLATGSSVALVGAAAAFALIGAGVGAAGTSLLALLAVRVAPERRSAAAAITWIMMVAGIVVSAGVAGSLIDPFSLPRLALVVSGVALVAFVVAGIAVAGIERGHVIAPAEAASDESFPQAIRAMWVSADARRFTLFVFMSMLAYSMQDMILEPFAGLVFGFTPGESTKLAGVQHGGVLAGMILVGVGANAFGGRSADGLRRWIVGGCVASALALAGLALAALRGGAWPLAGNVALLGFANGVFAVAAIGTMMALAGAAGDGRAGVRMGVWGAAQAIAFGTGGLLGAVAVDRGRALIGDDGRAFMLVFAAEAALFVVAATLAIGRTMPGRTASIDYHSRELAR
ncbi:MFS transporter [Sphingomonas sp. SFZ2018-12]|uniref:BCD family MFS transporter n=1 Tax=Sphingomonas sp. SFZ2018-12 TaxID=2683197 RepID=UPI00082EF44A|nr:BCD family MFS transporter [Sphingomonas sp. SFZ2018-12]MCH4891980.1 MFS transporter [Sphingomonas sp. SFZ2018-12]